MFVSSVKKKLPDNFFAPEISIESLDLQFENKMLSKMLGYFFKLYSLYCLYS